MRILKSSLIVLISLTALSAQTDDQIEQVRKLLQENKTEEARKIVADLYNKNDEDPQVNYYMGVIALTDNNYDDAIDYLDVAIEGDGDNHRYYFMLGNAYAVKAQNSGMFKAMFTVGKIKKNWLKAVELKPDFLDAHISLFQFYLNAPGIAGGNDDKAKEIIGDIAELNEKMSHALLATYHFRADEDIENCEKELAIAMQIDTTNEKYDDINLVNAALMNILGYHYLNNDTMDKSFKYFSQAIKTVPDRPNPYDSMGDFYVKEARYDSALVYYEKALKINPKFNVSRFNRGQMLEKLGRKAEAVAEYKKLMKDAPDSRYADEAEDRLDELED